MVSIYTAMKMMPRKMLHDLRENQLACIHVLDRPSGRGTDGPCGICRQGSSRKHLPKAETSIFSNCYQTPKLQRWDTSELFDKNFARAPKRYEKIIFEYDYHPLKRWILKICYNSARIHNSVDREALETLLPYVLGREVNLGRSTQLFAQLSYPELVSEYDVDPNSKNDEAVVFEPSGNRVGYMFFRAHGIGKKLLRAVHLRSYSFYLAYWPPGRGRAEQNDFEATFTTSNEHAKLLRPSLSSVRLQCDGMGAWSSFRDSRSTEFVFDVDV